MWCWEGGGGDIRSRGVGEVCGEAGAENNGKRARDEVGNRQAWHKHTAVTMKRRRRCTSGGQAAAGPVGGGWDAGDGGQMQRGARAAGKS